MVIEEEFDDIIFDLEGESDGWQTGYPYSEVKKAMTKAYNLAIQNVKDNFMSVNSIESLNKFKITDLK